MEINPLTERGSEPIAVSAAQFASTDQQEIRRRRRLGRVWIFVSLFWWLTSVIPIIYAVASKTPCATRFLPNRLIGGCP